MLSLVGKGQCPPLENNGGNNTMVPNYTIIIYLLLFVSVIHQWILLADWNSVLETTMFIRTDILYISVCNGPLPYIAFIVTPRCFILHNMLNHSLSGHSLEMSATGFLWCKTSYRQLKTVVLCNKYILLLQLQLKRLWTSNYCHKSQTPVLKHVVFLWLENAISIVILK